MDFSKIAQASGIDPYYTGHFLELHNNVLIRLVPDMTLTLKKTTLTFKMGGRVHLPQRGHVLLWLCY